MPLKLVIVGEAVAKIDATKKLKDYVEEKKVLRVFVWSSCPYLEGTEKESKNGKVWYCRCEDKFSNDAVPFSCQSCDEYKTYKKSVTPRW